MSDTPSQPAAVNVNVSLHLNHIAPLLEVVRAEKHRHNGRFNGKQHIADMFREIEWRVQHAEPVDPDATADEKPGIAQPAEASATLLEIHQIIECLDYASDKVSDLSQNELSDEISLTTDRAAKLLRSIFSNDVEQRLVSPDATAEDQDLGCDKCGAREDRDCTCTHPMSSSFLAASKPKLSRNAYIAQAKAYLHFGNVKPHTPENVLITGLCDLLEAEKPSPDYAALIDDKQKRLDIVYAHLYNTHNCNCESLDAALEAVSAPAPVHPDHCGDASCTVCPTVAELGPVSNTLRERIEALVQECDLAYSEADHHNAYTHGFGKGMSAAGSRLRTLLSLLDKKEVK